MASPIGVLLAAGLGTRYDPTGQCLKLMQPVHRLSRRPGDNGREAFIAAEVLAKSI